MLWCFALTLNSDVTHNKNTSQITRATWKSPSVPLAAAALCAEQLLVWSRRADAAHYIFFFFFPPVFGRRALPAPLSEEARLHVHLHLNWGLMWKPNIYRLALHHRVTRSQSAATSRHSPTEASDAVLRQSCKLSIAASAVVWWWKTPPTKKAFFANSKQHSLKSSTWVKTLSFYMMLPKHILATNTKCIHERAQNMFCSTSRGLI